MTNFENSLENVAVVSKREQRMRTILSVNGYEMALQSLNLIKETLNQSTGHVRHDGTPYYLHCVEVALHLYNCGYNDEDILIIALLHDYIEDVEGTQEAKFLYLVENFGIDIAKNVKILTKKPDVDYHTDIKEKEEYLIEILKHEKPLLVKLSDRTLNFTQLQNCSVSHLKKQLEETRDFYVPIVKKGRKLYPEHSGFIYTTELMFKTLILEYSRNMDLREIQKIKG